MRVVILCGGSGSRLWPESRESLPKQFIPIFDGKSLLDLTVERVINLKIKSKPIFVCNKRHKFLLKKSLEKYNLKASLLFEPEGKNTCAAIYLAAKHCSNAENLLIMPSDHLIIDSKKFANDILYIDKNLPADHWITLGVIPTKASEAYGYINVDRNKKDKFHKVIKFIEKPIKKIAAELIRNDDYYWNAGIFLVNTSMALHSIKKYAPKIAKSCDNVFNEMEVNNKTHEFNFPANLFSKIPSQSVDYAIMEHEKNIYLYPLDNKWSDIGSWDSISEIHKNNNLSNQIIQIESHNNFIRSEKRIIATIGIEDLIIIDNDNATLITKKNYSEKVKLVVNELLQRGLVEGKEHTFENRPWGKFENLLDDNSCKVKRIVVKPKKRLSLQYHNFRSEHWLIVAGKANVHLDGKNLVLFAGESIDIPTKSHHYIENKENEDLIIIETQLGSYFGEDDIIRLDDPYSR